MGNKSVITAVVILNISLLLMYHHINVESNVNIHLYLCLALNILKYKLHLTVCSLIIALVRLPTSQYYFAFADLCSSTQISYNVVLVKDKDTVQIRSECIM